MDVQDSDSVLLPTNMACHRKFPIFALLGNAASEIHHAPPQYGSIDSIDASTTC